jgi:dipeptidase E
MTKQIIAIGGGGFGRNPGEGKIENYILNQSDKNKPNVCFIPTATGDNEAYKVNYYSTFSGLSCTPTHLDFFKRTPDLEKLIAAQDIVFVGGGNTKSMLAVWKDWGLDKILRKAYNSGTIMCGVSAGANCWFEKAVVDSWSEELMVMDCMGFVKGNCCPHYDEEPERRPMVKKFLEDKTLDNCFAVEGGCALHIIDETEFKAVVFSKGKNAFEVDAIMESPYPTVEIY